jgi:hypothetical protein
MTGRLPGPLGLTAVTGLNFGLIVGPPVRANIWTKAARRAMSEFGEAVLRQALKNTSRRVLGKLFTGSREWIKAFEHISEHFVLKFIAKKETHTVFVTGLRSRQALEPLIRQTAKGYSHRWVGQSIVHSVKAGRPVIALEREFSQIIGETYKHEMRNGVKVAVKTADCKILRVILDITGKPITAYPVSGFGP